jgi:hypothetical protein
MYPHGAHVVPNVTNIEKKKMGGGCPAGAERRRRHRAKATQNEEGTRSTFQISDSTLKHTSEAY